MKTLKPIAGAVAAMLFGLCAGGQAAAQSASNPTSMGQGMDHSAMQHMEHAEQSAPKMAAAKAKKSHKARSTAHKASAKKARKHSQLDHAQMADHSAMEHSTMDHSQMDHAQMADHSAMDHSTMDHSQMDHSTMDRSQMDHSQMDHSQMDHSQMDHSQVDQSKMDHSMMDHSKMDHSTMDHSKMDHSMMDHSQMNHSQMTSVQNQTAGTMGGMQGMAMGPMQGGQPPPDARDPDQYAEGAMPSHLPGNAMNDMAHFGRVLFDKLEYAHGDGEQGQNLDAEAWYGGDYDKAWLKVAGERREGQLQGLRQEVAWDHAIAPFWSSQLGVRHDSGSGPGRTWAAFGVRGIAPYWFDTSATAYLRAGGGLAARLDVRYELLFTQRLILEPEIEANLYSKADPARGLGSGLADVQAGMRLRYEIRRQVAPYIGVTWTRSFGDTAHFATARGERSKTAQVVAGVRLWF